MGEEIKALIAKIQQEGIQAAEKKAKDIEEQAQARAVKIIDKAKKDAEKIIIQAKEQISRMEDAASASLKQAGRDMIITLKGEISAMLGKFIISDVREALGPQELAKIIGELVKKHGDKDIVISLGKEDKEALEKGFFSKLKEAAKGRIELKSSEDISGGFIISYDSGKSHYDFTDKALAEYIGSSLNPRLKEILEA
ncbi:MAG: hypothetical protein WC301_02615 [Candidatus Omnitrophota bacterium]|jgi:V/A-type H+-transporting ATPase subunit E